LRRLSLSRTEATTTYSPAGTSAALAPRPHTTSELDAQLGMSIISTVQPYQLNLLLRANSITGPYTDKSGVALTSGGGKSQSHLDSQDALTELDSLYRNPGSGLARCYRWPRWTVRVPRYRRLGSRLPCVFEHLPRRCRRY
jgi:hypothetical protein